MPYARALSSFRDGIRRLAIENAKLSEILALCDQLRDQEMVDLGVALDDQEGEWAGRSGKGREGKGTQHTWSHIHHTSAYPADSGSC